MYLALALYYQSYCHTLHTTGRKSRLHLTPQYRRELETYQAVKHTACLLSVHQIHIQTARRLDSLQNGRFGDFVEHNAVGFLLIQTEHFTQVPRDSLSFTVFIGCQPHLLGLLGISLQILHHLFLVFRNLVLRLEGLLVDAHLLFLQVTDMAVARHHLKVATQELFYRLGLSRRLYNHQILLHDILCIYFYIPYYNARQFVFGRQKYAKVLVTPYIYRRIFIFLTFGVENESRHCGCWLVQNRQD